MTAVEKLSDEELLNVAVQALCFNIKGIRSGRAISVNGHIKLAERYFRAMDLKLVLTRWEAVEHLPECFQHGEPWRVRDDHTPGVCVHDRTIYLGRDHQQLRGFYNHLRVISDVWHEVGHGVVAGPRNWHKLNWGSKDGPEREVVNASAAAMLVAAVPVWQILLVMQEVDFVSDPVSSKKWQRWLDKSRRLWNDGAKEK